MSGFCWQASGGRVIPLEDLTDEHLVNILLWMLKNDRWNRGYSSLKEEAIRRGLSNWRDYRRSGPLYDGDIAYAREQRARAESAIRNWGYPPRQEPVEQVSKPLSMLEVGQKFRKPGGSTRLFLKVQPLGDIHRSLHVAGHQAVGMRGGWSRPGTGYTDLRYPVVSLESGKLYWMASNEQVFPVDD